MPTKPKTTRKAAEKPVRSRVRVKLLTIVQSMATPRPRATETHLPLCDRLNLCGQHFLKCFAAIVVGLVVFVGVVTPVAPVATSLVQALKFSLMAGMILTIIGTWHLPFIRSVWLAIVTALVTPLALITLVYQMAPAGTTVNIIELAKLLAAPSLIMMLPIIACYLGYHHRSAGTRLIYRGLMGIGLIAIIVMFAMGTFTF